MNEMMRSAADIENWHYIILNLALIILIIPRSYDIPRSSPTTRSLLFLLKTLLILAVLAIIIAYSPFHIKVIATALLVWFIWTTTETATTSWKNTKAEREQRNNNGWA